MRGFESWQAHILTRRKPETLTTARAKHLTTEICNNFFKMWGGVLNKNNMTENCADRVFNLDETGLNTSSSSRLVYTKKGARDTYLKAPDAGRTMYSVLVCGSASGVYLPPLVVYKSKNLYQNWMNDGPRGCVYTCNESGYMMDINFETWFTKCFVKEVSSLVKPVILTFDGHGSHLTYHTISEAKENDIILVCLPPHTSHALQPLDVAVFKGFKDIWRNILQQFYSDTRHQNRCDKSEFPKLLAKLYNRLKPESLVNGFKESGLYPLDRSKVDHRILKDRASNIQDEQDLPTPHKALRAEIIRTLTPPLPTQKRGPRKRVQGMSCK